MKIVIVEDEGVIALFLQSILQGFGHDVAAVFNNGNSLFTFLKSNSVDLIFMDININGSLDGIQTANTVHGRYPDISFVYLTSYRDSETIKSAQSVRPLGFLIKPVVESDIEAIMMVVEGYKNSSLKLLPEQIIFGEYCYKINSLYKDDKIIALSKNEAICIKALVKNRNTYISSEQLISTIWENEADRIVSLRELVHRLRKKLPNLPLKSVPNVGYILSTT